MVLPLLAIAAIGAVAGAGLGAAVGPKEIPLWQRMLGGAALGGVAGAGLGAAAGAGAVGAAGAASTAAAIPAGTVGAGSVLAAPVAAGGLGAIPILGAGAPAAVGAGSVLAAAPAAVGTGAGVLAPTAAAPSMLGQFGAAVAANPGKTAALGLAGAGALHKANPKKQKSGKMKQSKWGSEKASWEGPGTTRSKSSQPSQFSAAVKRANAGQARGEAFSPRGVNNRWQDEEELNPYARKNGQFVLPRRF